jgi:hypothetical protein
MRAKEFAVNGDFWKMMLTKTDLADAIRKRYSMANGALISDEIEEVESETEA